jgi:Flp pilus assembly protein TadG
VTVMHPPCSRPRRRRTSDRGALSIFTVIITLVVVVFFGAIVDFEQKLEARHDANIAAEEAARAGAAQIDTSRAYAYGGTFVIDRQAAIRAAQQYLRTGGYTGTVTPLDDRHISVHVMISRRAIFLPLIGITTLHVQADAVADLVTGVEGEGR